jgi:hypothetical protein
MTSRELEHAEFYSLREYGDEARHLNPRDRTAMSPFGSFRDIPRSSEFWQNSTSPDVYIVAVISR